MNRLSKVVVEGFGYYIDEGLFDSVSEAVSNEQLLLAF